MSYRRLRAPKLDGELLAEPPLDAAVSVLLQNRARLSAWQYDFQGRSADRLRVLVRREVLKLSRTYLEKFGLDPADHSPSGIDGPLAVTGHQPELFHPGVWVKNFAAARIARQSGGQALNLIVDNDVPKNAFIRVPFVEGEAIKSLPVDFDDWGGEIPYEDGSIRDEGRFSSFAERVRQRLSSTIQDPLIDDFWPKALEAARRTDRVGLRFSIARRAIEELWGIRNWEVPLSEVCETEGFAWFVCSLLAHLPRFREIHNVRLEEYRRAHGIRSRHHPVPALDAQDDWIEAPFWVWRKETPRRRPLLAKQVDSKRLRIRIDGEDEPLLELPLGPDREACCAVEILRTLPGLGVRLRTRALTTTMFARLLLGDLFLHGIGGAKYDELGDAVARDFFRTEPPPYSTLSLTLWIGLPDSPATRADLLRVRREIRSLFYNPDRHLGEPLPEPYREVVAAKRAAIAGPVSTRRERAARFQTISECNEILRSSVAGRLESLHREARRIETELKRNSLAHHREFAAVIHSKTRLRTELAGITEKK